MFLFGAQSTDPAHNLSDAFGQKFSKDATKVTGFDNLFAMEIDPTSAIQEMVEQCMTSAPSSLPFASTHAACAGTADDQGMMGGMMQDLAFAIPGVDEAMSFAEIMKHVKSMEYSVIVFDTAPTGHTLRFLSFPTVLEKALGKLSALSGRIGPMMNQVRVAHAMDGHGEKGADRVLAQMSSLMGGGMGSTDDMFSKLESMRSVITEVNTQFKDPVSFHSPLRIYYFLHAHA